MDVLGELLETLRLDTLVHGRFILSAPWEIEFPDEDPVYLIAVESGDARLAVSGRDEPVALSAGDLAVLPRGGAHRLSDAPDGVLTTLVVAAFRFRAAHRALSIQRLSRLIHLPAEVQALRPGLASAVGLFIAESTSRDPGAAVVMNRLADILLVQAIRAYIAGTDCPQHGLRALADPQIAQALGLIHGNPDEPWTVERLAAAVALSRSAFAGRFSALVGAPPADYLVRWRMTRAAQLLRDGDLPIGEIASRSGYQSEASFNRAFKRLEGVTPGRYRRGTRRPSATT